MYENRIVVVKGDSFQRGIIEKSRSILFESLYEIENFLPACASLFFTAHEPPMKYPLRRVRFAKLLAEKGGFGQLSKAAVVLAATGDEELGYNEDFRKHERRWGIRDKTIQELCSLSGCCFLHDLFYFHFLSMLVTCFVKMSLILSYI
jgi:hypothetical protein